MTTKEKAEKLIELRENATQGEWTLQYDSCACGAEYGCRHPDYVWAVNHQDSGEIDTPDLIFAALAANCAADICQAYLDLHNKLYGPKGLLKQLEIVEQDNREMAAKLESKEGVEFLIDPRSVPGRDY